MDHDHLDQRRVWERVVHLADAYSHPDRYIIQAHADYDLPTELLAALTHQSRRNIQKKLLNAFKHFTSKQNLAMLANTHSMTEPKRSIVRQVVGAKYSLRKVAKKNDCSLHEIRQIIHEARTIARCSRQPDVAGRGINSNLKLVR